MHVHTDCKDNYTVQCFKKIKRYTPHTYFLLLPSFANVYSYIYLHAEYEYNDENLNLSYLT